MANLWKDGDVITAEKLNKFVFANIVTGGESDKLSLDITPGDVFDENNKLACFVVFRFGYEDTDYKYVYVHNSSYDAQSGTYVLYAKDLLGVDTFTFISTAKTDFFVDNSGDTK